MNALAREFCFFSLLRFAVPTIVMMLVLSFYTVVDGIFVSRFVGSNALSAVNIAMPLVNIVSGIGVMFATGGSAIVAKEMGENQEDRARGHFTLIVISSIVVGILFALVGFLFTGPIVRALGATELLYEDCYIYSYICLLFAPANIVKCLFDYFMVTAGKPQIGLANSVLGGVINIVLDYVFIVPMGMGVAGAAIATGLGQLLPAIVGILYFVFGTNILHFQKPTFEGKMLAHCCVNGASEMVTNLSMGITTFLFNMAMLHYLGENGVAAITIVLYAQFLMVSIFLGFTSGVAPVISFHYGAQNWEQERRIIRYCYTFLIACSIITLALSILFAPFLMGIFSPEGTEVYDLALHGFYLFVGSFLPVGINIFASGMFTAFSNGLISGLLSLLRTLVFVVLGIVLLPSFLGLDGVWLTIPAAELGAIIFSLFFTWKYRNRYGYGAGAERLKKEKEDLQSLQEA